MGIFSALFGDPFPRLLQQAAQHLQQGELGLAKGELEAALRAGKKRPEAELAPVRTQLAEVRAQLAEINWHKGQELAAAGLTEEAADLFHFALELLEEGEQARRVRQALAELDQQQRQAEEIDEEVALEGDEFLGKTFEERLEIFLGGIEDEDVAAQYRQTSRPFLEAVLLLQDGKADEAAASFEQLLAREGATPLLQLELGRALLFRGGATDAAQAVEHLRTWVTQHPDDFGASTSLAEALRQAERPDEATELLFQIAERAPRASLALQHLAEHLVTLGNWAEAAEACEEGLRHRPRSAELKQLLGLSLHGLGRHAEAVKLLEAVLRERWRLNPETGEVEFDRATAAVLIRIYLAARELNQAERAADLLGAMEREAPEAELPGIHLATAEALLLLGRTEEAKRRVTLARSLAADDPTIEQRAARLFAPTPS